jgi:hypothetical protein
LIYITSIGCLEYLVSGVNEYVDHVYEGPLASNADHAGATFVSIEYVVVRRLGVSKYDSCQVATVSLE